MRVEHWPIGRLVEYERNPRINDHAVDQVAAAIREFGFRVPILARSSGQVVDGHLRLKAARKLGLETVPVIIVDDLSEAQIKAFRISVNRLAELAQWDESLLKLELLDLQALDMDLSLTSLDEEMIRRLLEDGEPEIEVEGADPDAVPEVQEETVAQPGEVWVLGQHRVMCGDSTKAADIERLMAGQQADLLLTDPPYNVGYAGKTKDALTIQNDDMDDPQFRAFLRDAFAAADRALRPGGVFYIWYGESQGYNFRAACRDVGWVVRQCLIWAKNAMVLGRQDYHWAHEPCLYGWKEGAAHLWLGDRKQTTVLRFDRPVRNAEHPTAKPVALFAYLLGNNTRPGDIVLDPFGGSGTTLIAATQAGRVARLMEIDPRYVDVIIRRWMAYTGKRAVREDDGEPFNAATMEIAA